MLLSVALHSESDDSVRACSERRCCSWEDGARRAPLAKGPLYEKSACAGDVCAEYDGCSVRGMAAASFLLVIGGVAMTTAARRRRR